MKTVNKMEPKTIKVKFYEMLSLESREYSAGSCSFDSEQEAFKYIKDHFIWSGYEEEMKNVKTLTDIENLLGDGSTIDVDNMKYYPLTFEVELEINRDTGKIISKNTRIWFA